MIDWQTATQVADRIRRNVCTVQRIAATGELHGHQRKFKGRWTFAAAAVDAYVQGLDDRVQREACGCARLRAVRRTG